MSSTTKNFKSIQEAYSQGYSDGIRSLVTLKSDNAQYKVEVPKQNKKSVVTTVPKYLDHNPLNHQPITGSFHSFIHPK